MWTKTAVVLVGIAGCAPSSVPTPQPPAAVTEPASDPGPEAKTAFSDLEQRLFEGPFELRYHIDAEGAVEVDLRGTLRVGEEVELRAEGRFAGSNVDARLWTEGDLLHGGPVGAPSIEQPRPAALGPALVLGLTRMGLLHNLAMLTAGAPPDHADGDPDDDVAGWVTTVEHQWAADGEGISFGLVVAGEPSGSATLWLDEDGLPRRREQTVSFPEGQMRVLERYESVREPSLGAG